MNTAKHTCTYEEHSRRPHPDGSTDIEARCSQGCGSVITYNGYECTNCRKIEEDHTPDEEAACQADLYGVESLDEETQHLLGF